LGENDGFGITNDELSFNSSQSVTITFDEEVKLFTAYFLDTYFGASGIESGVMAIDGVDAAEVFASDQNPGETAPDSAPGFATIDGVFKGTAFTFFAGPGQDDNSADVSLAGVSVAAIPLPAAFSFKPALTLSWPVVTLA